VVSPPGGISFSYEPDNSTSKVSQVLRLPSAPPLEKLIQNADADIDTTILVLPALLVSKTDSTSVYQVAG
jgi:hypothetical protein